MKNFFKGIFKNKYPGRVNGDDNTTSGVYAGPDYFEKKKKPMGKVYAGPGFMDRNNTKCVYAGPEMMEKRKRASEMEDVYAGPPMDEPEDEPEEIVEEDNEEPEESEPVPEKTQEEPMKLVYGGPKMPVMKPVYAGPAPDGPMFDPKMMAAYAGPVINDPNQFLMAYAGPAQNPSGGMWGIGGMMPSMAQATAEPEKVGDLKTYKTCPCCGNKAVHTAFFCSECGADLRSVPATDEEIETDDEKED
ncbi:MAG: hypothetical protein II688_03050 [Lachnospiraceae bacterium]|nr:hypothetical protein [Lachnospiraceae bacterium]